jgi:hypothetical protein
VRKGALFAVSSLATPLFAQDAPAPSSGLDRDEHALLYATAAWLDEGGRHWRVPVHFRVFEPEEDDPLRAAVLAPLRDLVDVEPGTPAAERFAQRARLFFVDHERRERVRVEVGELWFRLGPTEQDGHAEAVVDVPVDLARKAAADGCLPLSIGAASEPFRARSTAWLVPPEGRSVVSDLDDTIKITQVRDRRAVVANTFLREFRPVPEMPDLYRRIASIRPAPSARVPSPTAEAPQAAPPTALNAVAFHYVSLSPWQLAPLIEEFLAREGFPGGSLHLQHFRPKDGDFGDLVGDSREKKLEAIEPLLATWPRRRFVLIGDSGQKDPEVYGELARRHPDQIERILIRDVTGESGGSRNGGVSRRLAAAFAGLPASKWQVFADPSDVDRGAR